MSLKSLVVLISGNGSNLQAIMDAIQSSRLKNMKISLVLSNKENAYGLERAKKQNIPTKVLTLKSFKAEGKTRVEYDLALAQILKDLKPDLIILAGWMHILSKEFLDFFPNRVINLHPALPGAFDGAHAIERAYEAFKKGDIKETGVMVHYCVPEVDRGQVLLSQKVSIEENDSLEDLENRIHKVEHGLLVEAVEKFFVDQSDHLRC